MKVPLDIPTLLWALTHQSGSERVRRLLPQADTWFRLASSWEILIKAQLGKIALPRPTGSYVMSKLERNGVRILDVTPHHLRRIELLPDHHFDPFERMPLAHRFEENSPLLTGDRIFASVMWSHGCGSHDFEAVS
jgi:PIN domain nuclease of toxin-antitoxin system